MVGGFKKNRISSIFMLDKFLDLYIMDNLTSGQIDIYNALDIPDPQML